MRADLGQEAHVGHAVGLVDRGDRRRSDEVAGALVDVVGEPAGGGDEQVDAALQLAGLPVERHAADDDRGAQAERLGERRRARRRPAVASSRVGTRTRPRGAGGRRDRSPASRDSSARPKASVLPEPVWPRPSRSRPARASGRVAAWIGNGAVKPCAASAAHDAARAGRARRTWACPTRARSTGPRVRPGGWVRQGRCGRVRRDDGTCGRAARLRRAGTAAGLRGCHNTSGTWRVARRDRTASPDASMTRPRGWRVVRPHGSRCARRSEP